MYCTLFRYVFQWNLTVFIRLILREVFDNVCLNTLSFTYISRKFLTPRILTLISIFNKFYSKPFSANRWCIKILVKKGVVVEGRCPWLITQWWHQLIFMKNRGSAAEGKLFLSFGLLNIELNFTKNSRKQDA